MPDGATRAAQVAGILGGLAWVGSAFVGDGSLETGLLWAGAVLVTAFLLDVGLLLVHRGLLALRLFVACALPLLFWMVVAFAAGAASDNGVVWGLAGAAVAVFAIVRLARPAGDRATL